MPFFDDRPDASQTFVLEGFLVVTDNRVGLFIKRYLVFGPFQYFLQGLHLRNAQQLVVHQGPAFELLDINQDNGLRLNTAAKSGACGKGVHAAFGIVDCNKNSLHDVSVTASSTDAYASL